MKIFDLSDSVISAGSLYEMLKRPAMDSTLLEEAVTEILLDVKENGDFALKELTFKFDHVSIENISVSETEMEKAEESLSEELKNAMVLAAENIRKFHEKQAGLDEIVETMQGVRCWRKSVPIEKVGLYIPGGSAPLFSTVLMLGIPAMIARCHDVIICSPPAKNGKLHPTILFAAKLAGISRVFKVGGAQAIAAMAFGTETLPRMYKIFGPGNQYVTCAKQLVQKSGVAIDMPAGPSEVCVLADETAEPLFVAADLLSQAEHGPDSQVLLVCESKEVLKKIIIELEKQVSVLPRRAIAEMALKNSKAITVANMQQAIFIINEYAPEHLIIQCANDDDIAERIINAGSVFIGRYSPESAGDYASGTNHTLPTNGYAKSHGGVSLDSFIKKITYQKLTAEGLRNIGSAVELMAEAEGLIGHKNAVSVRLRAIASEITAH